MIPLLERAVTKDKKWVKQEDIADVLVIAQTVPGSIAVNTATFIGYRICRFSGAVIGTFGNRYSDIHHCFAVSLFIS